MIWKLFTRRPLPPTPARATDAAQRQPFHAVDIVTPGEACEAMRRLDGVRFLSREGPPALPLAQCEHRAQCVCRYRHHEDRRAGPRRNSDLTWGTSQVWPSERERRRAGGRRASDR